MRLLFLLSSWLLLTSCALERDVVPASAGPLDSRVRPQVGLRTGKVKFNGPVTIQLGGAGNVATALTKAKAPVAAAPGASAEATSRMGIPTWQLVMSGLVLLVLLLLGVVYKFRRRLLAAIL
jgi:hypothetical protein